MAMLSRPDERNGLAAVVRDICGETLAITVVERAQQAVPLSGAPGDGTDGVADDGPVNHEKIIEEIRAAFDAELIDTENRE